VSHQGMLTKFKAELASQTYANSIKAINLHLKE